MNKISDYDHNGNPGMFKDITLDQIINFLSKFAERSPNVYWFSSLDFSRIFYVSPAYEAIWGRSREALYENPEIWINFLHPEDAKNYHPIHAMAKRVTQLGMRARYDANYRIIRPDGEVRWITDHGYPIYINDECCGITGVAIDITHERVVEEELRAAVQKAQRAEDDAKTHFLAKVSHELRTPLNGILGATQILLNKKSNRELHGYIKDIEFATAHLLNLVNDILDFSCFEERQVVIRTELINIAELVQSVISTTAQRVNAEKVRVIEVIDKNIPTLLIGDSFRIKQTLLNLVNNAIKFTPEGSVTVSLSCLDSSPSKIKVRFSVEDTGIGIPLDMQEKIFERFFQVDGGYGRTHEGVGLGLAISQQIVVALGSIIHVKSVPEKGSLFWFDLEMDALTLPEDNAHHQFFDDIYAVDDSNYNESFSTRVLVVEDNLLNQKVIHNMLTELGCDIELAPDGKSAIELAKNKTFDVIFMDIGLPHMDGLEVTRELRKLEAYQETPVIAVTAHAFEADIQSFRAASIDDVLIKPITIVSLKSILSTWGKVNI